MSEPTRQHADSDIAVVGMSGRFPAARTVDEYWANIRDKVECFTTYSEEELLAAGVPKALLHNPNYVRSGAPLPDMEMFDAGFFGFSPRDAAIMDPQHRHLLECAWEALEDAGHIPSRFDGSIGLFAGSGMQAYMTFNLLTNPELVESIGLFLLRHTGNDKDFLATRVSYCLDLKGPSVNVQTACSTSLVAVHSACQSLLSFECDLALAGGVTVEVPHRQGYLYKENEILSPDGHCRPFDADAKGTVFASAVGLVALRRLTDALEDGDVIHAVIKATAINNDGAGKVGYLAPSVDGHAQVVEEALAVADIHPEAVTYLETHGTGTPVGDPIEMAALTQAFRSGTDKTGYCGIGSVKSNIGHSDTAAGVASLIKVIQALKNRQLPASLGFQTPNPEIDFDNSPFYVNTELKAWEKESGPRRAGVSSLGVGGTNAHAILEEPPQPQPTDPAPPWQVLLFSGKTAVSAEGNVDKLASHLEENPELNLADVAYTHQAGRQHFPHRKLLVCRDTEDALAALEERSPQRLLSATAESEDPSVVFMFPGGGAQYPDMCLELYETEPVYRDSIERCLEILSNLLDEDLRALMYPRGRDLEHAAARLERPLLALPALFSTEYALAQQWMSWGIQPAAMTGHSMGEYTAACLAGVLSLEDALALVTERARLFETLPAGSMLSVPLPESEIEHLLGSELSIAAVNGPEYCVVAGPDSAIAAVEQKLEQDEVECRRLKINVAAHSAMLAPILEPFRKFVSGIRLNPPQMQYVSNVTGTWVQGSEVTDPDYWVRHLRQTVRFSDGLEVLAREESRIFLEVGPGTTLSSLTRMHPASQQGHAVVSCVRHPQENVSDKQFLLSSLGRLWLAGKEIEWPRLHGESRRRRLSLPTYAFDHQYYWIEPGKLDYRTDEAREALEKLDDVNDWFYRPVWKPVAAESPGDATSDEDARHTWLIFLDRAGLGSRIARRLEKDGHLVVKVREGDAFHALDETTYAMAPEEGLGGYEALFRDLAERERLPTHIAHLWTVTPDETFRRASNIFHQHQERGFYSALFIAQAIGNQAIDHPIDLTVVSNGMQRVAGETLQYPAKATLMGPVKVIPQEFDNLTCRSVDILLPDSVRSRRSRGSGDPLEVLAECLVRELGGPAPDQAIAYRDGQRWGQDFERLRLEPMANEDTRLREGGVYVVTGGLGGIGLTVAEHLAKTCRAKLVLISRSGLPERSDWENWLAKHSERDRTSTTIRRIRAMEEQGAKVLALAADVANIERMSEALWQAKERFGPIHGVIHAAGTLHEGVIQTKTPESVDRVLAPKVQGTLVLADLLADTELDFFVAFSSTSTILGPPGQVDYVAANSFLNAFADSRADQPGLTLALNWGMWREVGMARELHQRLSGQSVAEDTIRELAEHPLFDERLLDGAGRIEYTGNLVPESQWILDEHRLKGGRAILPGTAYVELARAALAEAGAGNACELRGLSFLAPLEVPDGGAREMRVSLTREDTGHYEFETSSRSQAESSWTIHAQGRLHPTPEPTSGRIDLDEIAARCDQIVAPTDKSWVETDQEGLLDFGPRWHALRCMRLGSHEALAEIELSEAFASDLESYGCHPALLDLATGFALRLVHGYQPGESLFVPLAYARATIQAALPRRIHSWVRSDPEDSADGETVSFDVVITDEQGRILVEVERFTMRRLDGVRLASGLANEAAAGGEADAALHPTSAAERFFFEMFDAGILADEGMVAFSRLLSSAPVTQAVVTSIELPALIKRNRMTAETSTEPKVKFARPNLGSEYAEPRDEFEITLVSYFEELLGVDQVGIHDSFFELGGHSLIAVHLMAMIKKAYDVELPLSVLFEAPTVAKCGELLRDEVGESVDGDEARPKRRGKHSFLVPLHMVEATDRPPLFLVSGMLGNVLNLRHLAGHLGDDQPVWALQARGLYGEAEPHRRFEEMAADYLAEVRAVQPEGPYFLGGFSGGGITALEMAQQLLKKDEEIAILIMLDTPPKIPDLTLRDRLQIQWLKLRQQGPGYFWSFARQRWAWETQRVRGWFSKPAEDLSPAVFRSAQIEAAFREALEHYEIGTYPGKLTLLRPPLDEAYVLGPDRVVNQSRAFVAHDNHWSAHITGGIEVHVVPGEHNSMVLEPHVRVLAERLRTSLEEAQRAVRNNRVDVPPDGPEQAIGVAVAQRAG
ncbi:MAG: SDR family NAD(P)-dependent oxidoreductase [bacterium]|nr:SDR family NAD(P)-dependent oxidoreductase [bacterium]